MDSRAVSWHSIAEAVFSPLCGGGGVLVGGREMGRGGKEGKEGRGREGGRTLLGLGRPGGGGGGGLVFGYVHIWRGGLWVESTFARSALGSGVSGLGGEGGMGVGFWGLGWMRVD